MNLDEAQKETVREWIRSGLGLSEIQTKLGDEFQIRLTYMEVRFLVDDLGVMIQDDESDDQATAPDERSAADPLGAMGGQEPESAFPDSTPPAGGGVTVSLDQVTRPSFIASGRVTFSDGKAAAWSVDRLGRFAMDPDEPGYQPSQNDLMDFQVKLQELMRGSRL